MHNIHRSVCYAVVAGLALALGSLPCLAQAAPPEAPAAPASRRQPRWQSRAIPRRCPAPTAISGGRTLRAKTSPTPIWSAATCAERICAGATLDGAILVGAIVGGRRSVGRPSELGIQWSSRPDENAIPGMGARFPRAVLTGAQLPFAGLEGAGFQRRRSDRRGSRTESEVGREKSRPPDLLRWNARMDRRAGLGAPTDLSGVIWNEPKANAIAPGPGGVICSGSDLSGVANPVFVSTQGTDSDTCGA